MKEFENDTKKWKDILCYWIGRINIVKISILPKAIFRFHAIPIKIPMTVFHRTRTNNLKIYMEPQKIPNCQSNLGKKKKAEGIMLSDFRLYYKATVIKTGKKQKHRSMEHDREPRNKPTHLWSINL